MADELEILTAQFDADIARFDKKMDQLLGDHARAASGVERRNAQLVATLNQQFSRVSFSSLLGAVGGAALLDKLVESSKELADTTINTAKATGLTAETIQGLGIIARKSGVDQDSLTSALKNFNAQIGLAQLGPTKFGTVLKALGVDIKAGPQAALFGLIDQINKLPKAQQDAIAKLAFGKTGVSDIPWISQGSTALKATIADLERMGQIVPLEKLEQVQKVFDAWQDIKTEALVGFMNGFGAFADQLTGPQFLSAVQTFGKVMGDISGFAVRLAQLIPTILPLIVAIGGARVGAGIGGAIGTLAGPEGTALGAGIGAIVGGVAGGYGSQRLLSPGAKQPYAVHGDDGYLKPPGGQLDLSGVLGKTDNSDKITKTLAALNEELTKQLDSYVTKDEASYVDLVKAQNDATAEMMKGTAAYYDFQNKAITENADLEKQKLYEERDAGLADIAARRDAQIASLATLKLGEQQFAAEKKQIQETSAKDVVTLAEDTADKVLAVDAKKKQALLQNDWQYQQSLQNLIQVNTTLRDGLTNIATAGLSGFKSMKQAAADLLNQIAQLIIKLYVMQPLLDSLFGPTGTYGGGLLGSFLGSPGGGVGSASFRPGADPVLQSIDPSGLDGFLGGIFGSLGFAKGGVFVPGQGRMPLKRFAGGGMSNQAAIFGEAGPEAAVPLPDGRSIPVTLRLPQAAGRASGSPTVIQQFDLSGAVLTKDLFDEVDRRAKSQAGAAVVQFDRHVLPGRVQQLSNDPRRRY